MTKKKGGVIFSAGIGKRGDPLAMSAPAELLKLAKDLDATVVDVRAEGGPTDPSEVIYKGNRKFWANGRIIYAKHGWWPYELKAVLGKRYRHVGAPLGGPGGGVVGPTEAGMAELERWYREGQRLVLLCICGFCDNCHRHNQIACRGRFWEEGQPLPMLDRGIDVLHVEGEQIFAASDVLARWTAVDKLGKKLGAARLEAQAEKTTDKIKQRALHAKAQEFYLAAEQQTEELPFYHLQDVVADAQAARQAK